MRMLATAVLAIVVMCAGAVAQGDEKPKPRIPTAAEKREIQRERKANLKEREERAKANAKQHKELAAKIQATLEPWEQKGLSGCVLVAKDGKVIFRQAYGFADREAKRKNTTDTYYDAAAVTRLLTTLAILRLEIEGKLKLDDKVSKYFKFAAPGPDAVTLRQLLSHTCRLTTEGLGEIDRTSRDEVIRKILTSPLAPEDHLAPSINSVNLNVAAAVIEVASGQKFEAYVRKAILEPAAVKDSEYCPAGRLDKKRGAVCYSNGKRDHAILEFTGAWTTKGSMGFVTTIDDLWKLREAMVWTDILDKTAQESLLQEVLFGRTSAFEAVQGDPLGRCFRISGSSWGARGDLLLYPDEDVTLILLSNEAHKEPVEPNVLREIGAILAAAK